MSATAATIIGSGIAAGASVGNTAFNSAQTRKAREWSEKMYERQIQDNLRFSSPEFQVARLRSAGLNPMLAYQGDQTVSPASAPSSPTASGALDASAFANIGLVKAQTDLAEAQADKLREDTKGSVLDNQAKSIVNELLPHVTKAQFDNLLKDLEVKDATISQTNQTIAKFVSEISLNNKQIKLLDEQINKLKLDNEIQKAINDYKTPYYKAGVDPDQDWQKMLIKLFASAFLAWREGNNKTLSNLWEKILESFSEGFEDAKEDFKDTFGIK